MDGLVVYQKADDDYVYVIVPASHGWAGQTIDVKDLCPGPLLMREFSSGISRLIEHALAKAGLKKRDLRTVMELDSTEGRVSAVEVGLGATFVSQWSVRHQLALHTLAIARVKGFTLARMFSLAYPPARSHGETPKPFAASSSAPPADRPQNG